MSLLRYIRENQRNVDGTYTVEALQMRHLREELALQRRLIWKLMREFKRNADKYLIPTRWSRAYRAVKAYFIDRRAK